LRADHAARLTRDMNDYFALPPERQQALRDLDARLHSGEAAAQARLWGALDRYAAWLDRQPEEKRREVLDAPPTERLALLRQMREKEWLSAQPARVKAEIEKLPADARTKRIATLRADERRSRAGLPVVPDRLKPAKPVKPADLPLDARKFLAETLEPALPREEKEALKKAEGKWPEYPKALLSLSERYLVYRPLEKPGPITGFKDLPQEVKKRPLVKTLVKPEGKGWPAWAESFTEGYRKVKVRGPLPPFGASRPADYPPATREFLEKKLAGERAALEKLEGQWPEYPRRLAELINRKGVVIPGLTPPGPREMWDAARAAP